MIRFTENIDLSDYKYVSTLKGYKLYRKMLNGKGAWAAVPQDGGEPFEISYEQARGFEPINPTDAKVQKKLRKALKYEGRKSNMRMRKESYSDIDQTNVWDAYELAAEYLGYEGLCDALAKAMGTDQLESNLKYICRVYEIPFMEDEEEFDESYTRKKTMKNGNKYMPINNHFISKCTEYFHEKTQKG